MAKTTRTAGAARQLFASQYCATWTDGIYRRADGFGHEGKVVGVGDAKAQTRFILGKIQRAVEAAAER